MEQASLEVKGDLLIIRAPYHPDLVREIQGILGRRWNGAKRYWTVHKAFEEQVREMIRPFFQIEGELNYVKLTTLRARIIGKSSRWYRDGVTIDEQNVFNPSSGYLDMRPNNMFEILDYSGGFITRGSAFEVEYTVLIRLREQAQWQAFGDSSYEILSGDNPIDRFLDEILAKGYE